MNYGFTPNPTTQRPTDDVANGTFWPVLNVADFCSGFSIDADIPNDMVMHAMVMAAGATNRRLVDFKQQRLAAGIARLMDDNGEHINGQPLAVTRYLDAVYSEAKARLIKDSITTGRRADAENGARSDDELADHYHARSTEAVAEIQGNSATGVYLI